MQCGPPSPQEATRACRQHPKSRSRHAEATPKTEALRAARGAAGQGPGIAETAAAGERRVRGAAADFGLPTAHNKRVAQRHRIIVEAVTVTQEDRGQARTAVRVSDLPSSQEHILLRVGGEQKRRHARISERAED